MQATTSNKRKMEINIKYALYDYFLQKLEELRDTYMPGGAKRMSRYPWINRIFQDLQVKMHRGEYDLYFGVRKVDEFDDDEFFNFCGPEGMQLVSYLVSDLWDINDLIPILRDDIDGSLFSLEEKEYLYHKCFERLKQRLGEIGVRDLSTVPRDIMLQVATELNTQLGGERPFPTYLEIEDEFDFTTRGGEIVVQLCANHIFLKDPFP